jgi:hypothetical protein
MFESFWRVGLVNFKFFIVVNDILIKCLEPLKRYGPLIKSSDYRIKFYDSRNIIISEAKNIAYLKI